MGSVLVTTTKTYASICATAVSPCCINLSMFGHAGLFYDLSMLILRGEAGLFKVICVTMLGTFQYQLSYLVVDAAGECSRCNLWNLKQTSVEPTVARYLCMVSCYVPLWYPPLLVTPEVPLEFRLRSKLVHSGLVELVQSCCKCLIRYGRGQYCSSHPSRSVSNCFLTSYRTP